MLPVGWHIAVGLSVRPSVHPSGISFSGFFSNSFKILTQYLVCESSYMTYRWSISFVPVHFFTKLWALDLDKDDYQHHRLIASNIICFSQIINVSNVQTYELLCQLFPFAASLSLVNQKTCLIKHSRSQGVIDWSGMWVQGDKKTLPKGLSPPASKLALILLFNRDKKTRLLFCIEWKCTVFQERKIAVGPLFKKKIITQEPAGRARAPGPTPWVRACTNYCALVRGQSYWLQYRNTLEWEYRSNYHIFAAHTFVNSRP